MLINFDSIQTLLNGTVEKIESTIRPNWDVNDSSDPSYIRGRTHWSEQKDQIFVDNKSVNFMPTSEGSSYYWSDINPFTFNFNAGDKIVVTWDGVDYNVDVIEFNGATYVGNIILYMLSIGMPEEEALASGFANTGEPFLILKIDEGTFVVTNQSGDAHTVSIFATIEVVHKLDSKYLPTDSSVPYVMDGDVYTKDEVYTKEETYSKDQVYTRAETLGNFYTRTQLDNNFLRRPDAVSTYLTQADAKTTYLNQNEGISYFNDNNESIITGEFYCPTSTIDGVDGIYYTGYAISSGEFNSLFIGRNVIRLFGYGKEYTFGKKTLQDSVFDGQYYGNLSLYSSYYENTGEPLLIIRGRQTNEDGTVDISRIYSNIESDGNGIAYVCGEANVLPKSLIPDVDNMQASIYDPQNKATDIFAYVDEQFAEITAPDVSDQIDDHDSNPESHSAIRAAIPTQLSQLSDDNIHRLVTDEEKAAWNAKSNFSGNYNDLTNKPTIPSVDDFATTDYVDSVAQTKADNALSSAKTYVNDIKNDLLNGAGSAYDTLKELGDLIDTNVDAIDALETVATGKADKVHSHAISDVSGLQSALDNKVNKTEFDSHTNDTVAHITSTERTNWNTAKSHADSAHAPSNAEPNQNAFSNVKIGDTTIAADAKQDTLTLVAGSNVTLTPDATNDKITIAAKDTVYTHPTSSGNKHIPSGGSSGQILRWSSDGTAVWGNEKTYSDATTSKSGLMSASDKNNLDSHIGSKNNPHGVTASQIGAAPASHGNHVPTTQTADSATFLRNDNTWQKVTPANIGAATTDHKHSASDVTSGTFSADRIPSLAASKINSGTFDAARIPSLDAGKITSGNFSVVRGGTGRDTLTAGSYLVGNGTGAVALKTKEQVKADLGITGSGGAGLLPQIIVTTIPGSTVTCSKGDITLTAEEVDGVWTFDVPAYGAWTLALELDGTVIDSKAVQVDTVRQYFVELLGQEIHYTMLYDYGDECEDLTGGWTTSGYPQATTTGGYKWNLYAATKNTDHIATVGGGGASINMYGLGTLNLFNTESHNAIFALAKEVGTDGLYPCLTCGVGAKGSMMNPSVDFTTLCLGATGTRWAYTNTLGRNIEIDNDQIWEEKSNFGETDIYVAVASYFNANRKANWHAIFMTREDDRWTLCSFVEIDAPDSVITLVNNTDAVTAILANETAVNFMLWNCTGDFMAHAIQSATFLSALEASPYKELVYANIHWAKFLAMVA